MTKKKEDEVPVNFIIDYGFLGNIYDQFTDKGVREANGGRLMVPKGSHCDPTRKSNQSVKDKEENKE